MPDEIQVPGTLPTTEKMRRMMFVAQMRASADRNEMGFIGGYMDEKTGEVFMQSNLPDGLAEQMLPELLPQQLRLEE